MFFVHQGISVHYAQKGEGRPLLLLHGWGADSAIFSSIISHYKASRKVITLDFPPFGLSGMPDRDLTVSDYADMVYALLCFLGAEGADIICHSFGGRVAAKLVSLYNGVARSIVFCGSAGLKRKKTPKTYLRRFGFRLALFLARFKIISPKAADRFYSADYLALPQSMRKTFVNIINEDLSHDISLIDCPCLLIWGKKDRETPPYMGKKFNRLIAGSSLHLLENCGHYVFLDNFEKFICLTDGFFKHAASL